MNPTDYSIYCPEANQKKTVERYYDKLGYQADSAYSGSDNEPYDCIHFFEEDGQKYYNDCKKEQIGNLKLLTFSEWQSMVEEVPPPGIESFKTEGSMTFAKNFSQTGYNSWAKAFFGATGWTIHSISVEGVVWEVGEEVIEVRTNKKVTIVGFEWLPKTFKWKAVCKTDLFTSYLFIESLSKLPSERKIVGWSIKTCGQIMQPDNGTISPQSHPDYFEPIYEEPRTPVVELPDENDTPTPIYEGGFFWWVGAEYNYNWGKEKIEKYHPGLNFSDSYYKLFSTEAAAIKFVRENKPVYPEAVIQKLIETGENYIYNRSGELSWAEAISKLNQYKAKQ